MSFTNTRARLLAMAVTAVMALSILAPMASFASAKRDKQIAVGLAAVSAYMLVKGKTGPGLLAAAGAAYMYKKSKKDGANWSSILGKKRNALPSLVR